MTNPADDMPLPSMALPPMSMRTIAEVTLRPIVSGLMENSIAKSDLAPLVVLGHAMIRSRLQQRCARLPPIAEMSASRTAELARGLTEEWYRHDEDVSPDVVLAMFSDVDVGSASDEELVMVLRRSLFSYVEKTLFTLCAQSYPGFEEAVREIRMCIVQHGEYIESVKFGERVLTPVGADHLLHRPSIDRETLHRVIQQMHTPQPEVHTLLSGVAHYLTHQMTFCRCVPFIELAVACCSTHPLLFMASSG